MKPDGTMPITVGFGVRTFHAFNPGQWGSVQGGDAQGSELFGTAGVAHGSKRERHASAQMCSEDRSFGIRGR